MVRKAGFLGGNLIANNIQAGVITISGGQKTKSVSFNYSFDNVPFIVLTQVTGSVGSSNYKALISGSAFVVSGATTAGFTIYRDTAIDPTEINCSGGMFHYIAIDYLKK